MEFKFFTKRTEHLEEKLHQRIPDEEANKIISKKIDIKCLAAEMETNFGGFGELSEEYKKALIEAFAHLALEFKEDSVEYDTIFSDDASGRIVSLFLKHLIDKKKKEINLPPTKIYFLPGGRFHGSNNPSPQIKNFIENKKPEIKKALLSTEYIESGQSIKNLMNILENEKINFDVASLSMRYPLEKYDSKIKKSLRYGEIGPLGQTVFWAQNLAGVKKQIAGSDRNNSFVLKKISIDQTQKENIRKDINMLAEKLSLLLEN